MYTYKIEKDVSNPEILSFFKEYYTKGYNFYTKAIRKNKINFFVVARNNDKIIGAAGLSRTNNKYTAHAGLVHPNYRHQYVAASMKYISFKYCIDNGAEIISVMRRDTTRSHQRFIDLGFIKKSVNEDNKGERWAHYIQNVINIDMKLLNSLCLIVALGNQHLFKNKELLK